MDINIKLYKRDNRTYSEALEKMSVVMQVKKREEGCSSFVFSGCEPNVGVTAAAINLAVSLAEQGFKTAFVDADLRKFHENKRMCDVERAGITDYLLGNNGNILYDTNFNNLTYIPCGSYAPDTVKLLSMAKLETFIAKLKEAFDFVIIDTVAVNTVVDASLLAKQTDGVVLVVMENVSMKESLNKAHLEMKKIGVNVVGVVVNKVDNEDYKAAVNNFDYFQKMKYRKKKGTKVRVN